MVRTGRGKLVQNFKVRLDIEQLIGYIAESVIAEISDDMDDVEANEWTNEDMELGISGTYSTSYKSWWCSATLESPEEFDIEREYIGDVSLRCIPEELRKFISVIEVEENDEDVDYGQENEPDPDRAYDEWKDRQLEGDEY